MKLFEQHISARWFFTARQSRKSALGLPKLLLATLLIAIFFTAPLVNAKSTPTIKLSQSAEQVWQRQQVLITLTVITDDPFARLEVDSFSQEGFSITPFELQRIESDKQTTLTLKWAVFAFVAGKHALKLPRVRYRPNRGRMQTLALKTLALKVRRLPLYVSPTMPVGKISLASNWKEGWLVTTDSLLEWQIILEGKGVTKQFMPPLSRQIISTQSVDVLPIKRTQEVSKLEQGINQKRHYLIPIKALKSGVLNLPEIKVQYFEPTTGKLQKTLLTPPFVLALNKWLLGSTLFLFTLFLIYITYIGIKKISKLLSKRKKLAEALQQLSQATNYQQIRNALNQYSQAKGWGENLVLEKMSVLCEQQAGGVVDFKNEIIKLQALQFSQLSHRQKSDLQKIKDNLLSSLKKC